MERYGAGDKMGKRDHACFYKGLHGNDHVPLPHPRTRGHRHDGSVAYHGKDVREVEWGL